MTYICHDTVRTAPASTAMGWLSAFKNSVSTLLQANRGETINPRSEHLMRDAGLCPAPQASSISDQLPYWLKGTNIRFVDLFLASHIDRTPTRRW